MMAAATQAEPLSLHVFPLAPNVARLVLWTAAVALIIAGALQMGGASDQWRLELIAAAVCGGAAIAGLLPVWFMSRHHPFGGAYGFLVGILFRMFVAGAAVVLTMWVWNWPQATKLAMWIAAWYLIVLLIEVRLLASYVRSFGRSQAEPPPVAVPREPESQP